MDFWGIANTYGFPIACLVYAVMALYFEWVVTGKRYRAVCRQRDRLLALVISGQRKTKQAADVAEALLPQEGDPNGD